jgi:hypothetical protein
MKRFFLAAAAALTLSACTDAGSPVEARSAADAGPRLAIWGVKDSIYTSQTPTSTLDASGGWEVGTQFTPDYDGRVVGFRFYKAVNECGTHTARLWSPGGSQLASGTFSGETASGWQRVLISGVNVTAGTTYRVSVNTNCWQVKDFGYFTSNGAIVRNWGYADSGYYGQPTGSRPTSSSGSSFFVDVYFRPLLCDDVVTENCM